MSIAWPSGAGPEIEPASRGATSQASAAIGPAAAAHTPSTAVGEYCGMGAAVAGERGDRLETS